MLTLRKAADRGHFEHGWLDTYHTFSFADYYDEKHMAFRSLRVINEDRVAPGEGFGMHAHKDMEIVTCVLEGALEHRDSLGNGAILRPGEMQRMSAGSGIRHSEFNPSSAQPVHLYQIWIETAKTGITPSYEQKAFPATEKANRFREVVTPDARNGSLRIYADASLYLASLAQGAKVEHALAPGRHAWLQILSGSVTLNGHALSAGDGAALSEEPALALDASSAAEVLLFDLA